MNKRRLFFGITCAASAIGLGLRIEGGTEIEGPQHHSEVLYVSANRYQDGHKEDDRLGDVFLAGIVLGGLGALLSGRLNRDTRTVLEA